MMFGAETRAENFVSLDVGPGYWGLLIGLVVGLLALDLWRHREAHEPSFTEASVESAFWVTCAVAFGGFMLARFGADAGAEYFGVYVTEKSLSVDNVFVWSLIFTSMAIPLRYQHRVLFWGIFGALTLRAIFIWIGAEVVERYSEVLVIFGLFLVYTALKIIRHRDDEAEEASTAGLSLLRRVVPVSDDYDGQRFLTRLEGGTRAATPLMAALVVVEATDVVFAVDSVPASFGVANDRFILISANAFAIMGLRAMYFLLAGARDRFHYLSHALGAILLFVGLKLVVTPWYHIPIAWSLAVIVVILAAAIVLSLTKDSTDREATTTTTAPGRGLDGNTNDGDPGLSTDRPVTDGPASDP